MDAKPPIWEFLRIIRRTFDFGVLNIINNIFRSTQNLQFFSFCGGRKTSDSGIFAYNTQNLRFWRFCGGRRPSKIGVTSYMDVVPAPSFQSGCVPGKGPRDVVRGPGRHYGVNLGPSEVQPPLGPQMKWRFAQRVCMDPGAAQGGTGMSGGQYPLFTPLPPFFSPMQLQHDSVLLTPTLSKTREIFPKFKDFSLLQQKCGPNFSSQALKMLKIFSSLDLTFKKKIGSLDPISVRGSAPDIPTQTKVECPQGRPMDSRYFESRSTPSPLESWQPPHFEKSGYAPGNIPVSVRGPWRITREMDGGGGGGEPWSLISQRSMNPPLSPKWTDALYRGSEWTAAIQVPVTPQPPWSLSSPSFWVWLRPWVWSKDHTRLVLTCRISTVSLIPLGVKLSAYHRCMITANLNTKWY